MTAMKNLLSPFRAAVLVCVLLPSCNLLLPKPDFKPHDKLAVVPQDFLFSTNRAFNEWLDTPLQIHFTELPLREVFAHPALRDLNVRWVGTIDGSPRVTIHRVAITRRQLLWAVAQDHQLLMTAIAVPNGDSYVEIRKSPAF